jgi:hypothetical protein
MYFYVMTYDKEGQKKSSYIKTSVEFMEKIILCTYEKENEFLIALKTVFGADFTDGTKINFKAVDPTSVPDVEFVAVEPT